MSRPQIGDRLVRQGCQSALGNDFEQQPVADFGFMVQPADVSFGAAPGLRSYLALGQRRREVGEKRP
jgi:hypothetical protein